MDAPASAAHPAIMTERKDPRPLPAHVERKIAVAAECDPRTVRRALLGLPVRSGMTLERIRRALRELGRGDPDGGR